VNTLTRSGSIKAGRILGIDLKFHFSLVFLLVYVAVVSAMQFPLVVQQAGLDPAKLSVGPWASGFIFAVGLLVSIVIHEYSHVAVAKAQGVPVRGVTLMMLGGISEMGSIPEQPYAELKLALVGPLASLAIWVFLECVGILTSQPDLELFSYWLGNANLVLAIFNLLPAFPLDGGRALRSFLAAKQGKIKGSENAIRVSKFLAWGLGLLGFFEFNFILVFVALFIYSAAQSEWVLLVSRSVLKDVLVRDAMQRVDPVPETLRLREAASVMLSKRVRILPVETSTGKSALADLESLREVDRERWDTTPIREVMVTADRVINANDPIGESLMELAGTPLRALPVEEDGKVIGVLEQNDLAEIIKFKSLEESTRAGSSGNKAA
jgi:Zn-dependent protease/CBS domain-containing protein